MSPQLMASRRFGSLRWSHQVVYVRDMEAMLDFYTEMLGFEISDRGALGSGDREIVFMSQSETDHHQIAFLNVRQDEGRPNSVDHSAFRVDSLTDVRTLADRLEADGRASEIAHVTHGNAWSVYFRDPELNGIEVFCDSPWHVRQPEARSWDKNLSDEELFAWTEAEYKDRPEFGPIEDFYAGRARHLRNR